jgi:hypothetical protein
MTTWNHVTLCILTGVILIGLYLWLWRAPRSADKALRAFPRSVWPARLLALVSVVWFGLNLQQVDLGGFNPAKRALIVLVPLGYFLLIRYLSDLLAVRGLCALVLLGAKPVLTFARWHGTPASLALVIFWYLLILKAMFLMVYPHLWIRGLTRMRDDRKLRNAGAAVGIVIGVVLLAAGLFSL